MTIKEAYNEGHTFCVVEDNKNNIFRLHRLRKKTGVNATGKLIDGKYVVVFWDRILTSIGEVK